MPPPSALPLPLLAELPLPLLLSGLDLPRLPKPVPVPLCAPPEPSPLASIRFTVMRWSAPTRPLTRTCRSTASGLPPGPETCASGASSNDSRGRGADDAPGHARDADDAAGHQ